MLMDPYSEQRLRDEVIYLHSLWHRGPPRPPNPNPNIANNQTTSTHPLPPSNPPQSNKPKRPKRKTPPQSDPEWPCNKAPAAKPTWPAPTPAPTTRILTPEEQAQFAATRVQNKAIAAVEGFFADNLESDGEESDEDANEEFQFFLKLFTQEEELKGYCEKNWDGRGGEFVCLVCGGMAKRKKFKNLVAVVQHSVTVARTKKKNAHRAYAQVVCKVLGWDVDRLPTIDSSSDQPVGSQGNAEVAVGDSNMINQDLALASASNVKTIEKEVMEKQFKKPKRPKKTPPKSDLKWSCNETPTDLTQPGWPSPAPAPTTLVLTPEEQAQFVVTQVQNKAMAAMEAFFAGNLDSDGEDSDDEDEVVMGVDGYEEYQFFLKLFTEEEEFKELKGYYEKNWNGGGGEFVCLVCGGIGKRRKRYKNLVAVVTHSVMLKRTKKKNAHRAYAQVVCRVLGWDIDRLPTIDSSSVTGNAEVAVGESRMINQDLALANVSSGKTIQDEVSDVDQDREIPSSSITGTSTVIGDPVVICENSVKDGDASKCLEKLDNGVQSSGYANTGVVTCLEHSEDNGAGNEIGDDQKAVVFVEGEEWGITVIRKL